MTALAKQRWDLFCTVVDNYGDIGVGFRLARQLAAEHGLAVRLWVDDVASFRKICPEIDTGLDAQLVRGVEVRRWTEPFPDVEPAEVVVEAFGCALPQKYVAAMAARERKTVWINLEYLSAEDWVAGCHGLPSPHPSLPLVKYFFFPGFGSNTGGLLAERGLAQRRTEFQRDAAALGAFWRGLDLPLPAREELRVSLFCYENDALSGLFESWAAQAFPVRCLVPEGRVLGQVGAFFGAPEIHAGNVFRKGSLEVHILHFVEQDDYDRLLWACDLNFVRGEDSFVRAQWAARPMVWHIYPQQEGAHWAKIDAFLDAYCADLPPEAAAQLRAFWQAWNAGEGAGQGWAGFWQHRDVLEAHARHWAEALTKNGDLAWNLVQFCRTKV